MNLYTRDYFQLMYNRLAEGGIATYWLPVTEQAPVTASRPSSARSVMRSRTVRCGAPHCSTGCSSERGSAQGPGIPGATFAAAWSRARALHARLREVGLEEPEQIGATFIGDAAFLRELSKDAPAAGRRFSAAASAVPGAAVAVRSALPFRPGCRRDCTRRTLDPSRARDAFAGSDFIKRLWPPSLVAGSLQRFDEQRMINRVLWEGGRPLMQIEDLHSLLTRSVVEDAAAVVSRER